MRSRILFILFVCTFLLVQAQASMAAFVIQQQGTMSLNETPLDIAVSSDGQWSFVLTSKGNIHILAANGAPVQVLAGAEGYDRIQFAGGNRLVLTSSSNKELKIIVLDQLHELDISNSPYRGPSDARVWVAVFDDFQ